MPPLRPSCHQAPPITITPIIRASESLTPGASADNFLDQLQEKALITGLGDDKITEHCFRSVLIVSTLHVDHS